MQRPRAPLSLALLGLLSACQHPAPAARAHLGTSLTQGTATSADGLKIAWTSRGAGEPTLVFVHCWSCDQTFWREQVEHFSRFHRVVTLDLAGHGASQGGRAHWTISAFGEDVKAVADALQLDSVILVGHSMGGPVALEAARLLPGRVKAIIPIDTLHDSSQVMDAATIDGFLAPFEKDFAGSCRQFVSMMFPATAAPAIVEETAGKMCRGQPAVAVAMLRAAFSYDEKAGLAAAGVPIRAVNDSKYATNVEANRQVADFDATILKDVGHFPMLVAPDELDAALAATMEKLSGR